MTVATDTPTLKMVAAAAGVSKSTVSRVINDSPSVTKEAVAAVSAAIEQLGYTPNRAARTLVSRRTQTLALVIPENTATFFTDPYFASVIQGAATRVSETEFTLALLIAGGSEDKVRRYLRAGSVDGALVLSHHADDRSYSHLAGRLPLVFGGRPMSQEGDLPFYVDVDNVAAAQEATRRLVAAGRRRIATVAGPADMAAGVDRLEGWRRALAEAGQSDDLVERGDFSPASGEAAARRLLERGEPFDGLFAASAQLASGALRVLREHGRQVPHDLGLVTVDDDYFAQGSTPPLTTVRQPTLEVGRRMADVLIDLVMARDVERVTIFPTEIVDRGSA
ncbi:LacI family DNA-binding transcriptional regulator [Microlunatus flavus]|uniref:LacI family transcriptional regulator n=1 Tax=Microlunatus flavus TaxID=1036181 RepID=A0A1H8ZLN9_9ACTN|nr:LacI family DNA-binding transcriptional regulator [Microlunatus flavus]SEP65396.1 LacI family transcriptional regulator [Microlunatus flavus]